MITSNPILFTIICVFALQAMVLSSLIALKRPRRLANIFLALLVFFYALVAFNIVLVNVLKDYDLMHVFRYVQLEMLYGIGPALYFYTRCITNPDFTFKKHHWWHFLPLLLEFIFYRTSFYRDGSNGLYETPMPDITYVYLTEQWLGIASILIYSFISLGILIKYQNQLKNNYSKIENRSLKWLQTPIIVFAGYYITWEIITNIDRFAFDRSYRDIYFLPNFVILSIVTYWIGFKGYIQKEREQVSLNNFPKESKEKTEEKDQDFITEFQNLMESKKPYLNQDLNLSSLAELLGMKPKQLSAKINQNYGQNFYDVVNSYRVEAFKARLQSSERDKLSLLGHAFECGFYSKSTFNHVFKKMTHLTPSEYLKNLKKAS